MSGENLSTRPMELAPESLDPAQIETFLQEHPAFFKHRPELLMAMELPHGGPGAVSLIERQVNLLRERNIEMRNRLATITRNAESNDALFESTRAMVLSLLECAEATAVPGVVERGFNDHFGVEYASQLWFESAQDHMASPLLTDPARGRTVASLLKNQRAFCGVFRSDEMSALFPNCSHEGSAAIAPLLVGTTLVGALAVGSSDVRRYDGSVGTLFLEHIAEVIVRLPFIGSSIDR